MATRTASAKGKAVPKTKAKTAAKPTRAAAAKAATLKAVKPVKAPKARMSLAQAMAALEQSGSEQTRKTWARHGVTGPMFGVNFSTLKTMLKQIGVDHDLGLALWDTGNFDARNLAFKVIDPALMTPSVLDRWAKAPTARMCGSYVGAIAAEGPHGLAKAKQWLGAADVMQRATGWSLVGQLASLDESTPDAWFLDRIATIEKTIHEAPNAEREKMNGALIQIGTRNGALRKAAVAAAKRIGKVEIDHGDTECKTPDAVAYIEKAWAHSTAKGFDSPAAQERARESMRLRC